MKHAAIPFLFLLAFCAPEPAVTIDTREPIGTWYVGSPELSVRKEPNDAAEVVSTYQNGEAISVLARRGEWAEVRTGDSSGWARMSDLTNAAAKQAQDDNPDYKFRVMPLPVTAPSARGEIYIMANVNSDGEVISTKILSNTTGSLSLATQNESALQAAKFHPIVQKGERKPFQYFHKVTY